MVDNRHKWLYAFSESSMSTWQCPSCGSGNFRLIPESLIIRETAESRKRRGYSEWTPYDISERFVCILKCSNNGCNEVAAVSGTVFPDEDWDDLDEYGRPKLSTVFLPIFFYPAPHIISIPSKCPDSIKEQLEKAFSLYWCDTSACANRIRSSIEKLLDYKKIRRFILTKKGEKKRLSLHDRIVIFEEKEPELAKQLLAIKWIGNDGSHATDLTKENLLDCFEILQYALEEIIGKRTKRLQMKTKQIIKNKGIKPKRGK